MSNFAPKKYFLVHNDKMHINIKLPSSWKIGLYMIVVLTGIIASCSPKSEINHKLKEVEGVMVVHPDSAIRMLAEMDTLVMSETQNARQEKLYV